MYVALISLPSGIASTSSVSLCLSRLPLIFGTLLHLSDAVDMPSMLQAMRDLWQQMQQLQQRMVQLQQEQAQRNQLLAHLRNVVDQQEQKITELKQQLARQAEH